MLTWTTEELADILDVTASAVRGWIQKKWLRAVKTCNWEGNRIRESSLLDFLDDHPKYRQIFLHKLNHNSTIGNRNSKDVYNYLQQKGYLI
ncbi:MAG: helix-turn-helix domain-containing protein [Oscillospiraceae bacterium]|nr:helix-turn-helix domain-containing protein [Oscillospiraceae bacterium]